VGTCLGGEKMLSEDVPLKPQRIIYELERCLPEDATLFVDVGNAIVWATHYMKIKRPGSLIMPFGLLAMGFGIAGAIGGKVAAGKKPIVCLAGDGCFLMNGMEVQASVSEEIPVVYVILNNRKLGLVHDLQTFALGKNTVATRFKQIDAAKVAEGLGAVGCRVEKPGDLERILPEAIKSGKTVVIDCLIDPEEVGPLAPFVEGSKRFAQRLDFA
jgi:acetolactate synthase-1/2/3 large subunit